MITHIYWIFRKLDNNIQLDKILEIQMSLYFLSFGAGILSFLSPCVLPLIPGYISFINGTTLEGVWRTKKFYFRRPYFLLLVFLLYLYL